MKKVVASILILSIILSLFQPIVLAEEKMEMPEKPTGYDTNDYSSFTVQNEKDNTIQNTTRQARTNQTSGEVIANILSAITDIVCFTIISTISRVSADNFLDSYTFSIYDTVQNKIQLFDANYLLDSGNTNVIHNKIKDQVQIRYLTIRNLASILSLVMLIYIGIRMALSTLSEDKARYKKMLSGWIQSFILIFVMHYLILFSMVLAKNMVNIISSIKVSGVFGAQGEYDIISNSFESIVTKYGWDILPQTILFVALTYYQCKFFTLYLKRAISVAFLIIISPLITVTYSIDKAGDGRAQAFGAWIKEFEVNMFIQPLHALLYLIFIASAGTVASKAPLLYVVFFMALGRGEKVIKGLFDARGLKSIGSMGKGKGKKVA